MEQLCILLVLSIGYGPSDAVAPPGPVCVIIYGCGYVKSRDYWRLGVIFWRYLYRYAAAGGLADSGNVELKHYTNVG